MKMVGALQFKVNCYKRAIVLYLTMCYLQSQQQANSDKKNI
jgi:hypothetical protein